MATVRKRATLPKRAITSSDVLACAKNYAAVCEEFIDACNRHLAHTRQPHECGKDEICKLRQSATIAFTRAQNELLDTAAAYKPTP